MKLKDTRLDVEALLTQALFGHGFAHYGYWPNGRPETPSAMALGKAQQDYFELLASTIPKGVERILDVGSGTGENALQLVGRGYRLECLCPSEQLNGMARAKLPADVIVSTLRFEDYDSPNRFDMCLFAESFHYINLGSALAQGARYARDYMLILDYFRRQSERSGDETRGTHAEFAAEVARQGVWRVVRDDDVTEQILPTFFVLDHIKNTHVAPFLNRFQGQLREQRPFYAWLVKLFAGRQLRRMQQPSRREQTFAGRYEYRLILLERN
jgi:SAM-dependent methyltransferase